MTSRRPLPINEGEIVAGKYRIERILGTGGMGVVVAARHLQLEQSVALKFLLHEALASREAVSRFLREAQVLARLKSPHVARVMDVGTLEDGEPYLVMEYLHGADLASVLAERGRLPVPEAIGYVLQACEAIAEAHANGIVHRDLKPSNLFLTHGPDGLPLVKVLDFGIAKAIGPSVSEGEGLATTTGSFMGSPLYVSPEQIRNPKRVDARTDIWSLGVMLYELLSGVTPFDGETSSGALAAIVADAPAPLGTLRAELAGDLEAIVARCLEKDPDARPQSILDLAIPLEEFVTAESRGSVLRIARVLGVAMPPVSQASRARSSDVSGTESKSATVRTWEGTTLPSQRVRRWAIVLAAIGTVSAVGFFGFRRSPSPAALDAGPSVTAVAAGPGGARSDERPAATGSSGATTPSPQGSAPRIDVVPAVMASAAPAPSASAAAVGGKQNHVPRGNVGKRTQHATEDTDNGVSDRK